MFAATPAQERQTNEEIILFTRDLSITTKSMQVEENLIITILGH
jgi:hypothetical protein